MRVPKRVARPNPATRLRQWSRDLMISCLRSAGRGARHDALPLFDRHELIDADIRDVIFRAARPLDVDRPDGRIAAEAEGQRQVALR